MSSSHEPVKEDAQKWWARVEVGRAKEVGAWRMWAHNRKWSEENADAWRLVELGCVVEVRTVINMHVM